MASSKELRQMAAQHKPKNTESGRGDKAIHAAMKDCIKYLSDRLRPNLVGYHLSFEKDLSFGQLIRIIRQSGQRHEFDNVFNERTIKPDGGVIWLRKDADPDYAKIVVVSEIKKQGTNVDREKEGKPRQAQGNAIERLGKNLTGIRAALNHEILTPFACFGWGCDFEENYDKSSFVMSKISMMNEFYPLNKTHVFKKDGAPDKNRFAPVSMYFREPEWAREEMFEILKEIGETALRYYLF